MLASVGVSDLGLELDWLTQVNHIEGQAPHVHDTLCGLFTVNANASLGSFTFTSDGMRLLVGAEGAQASSTGGGSGVMEQVSGGDGVSASVGDTTRAQLCHGEISKRGDAGTAVGAWKLIQRGGERRPGPQCGCRL